MPRPSEEHGYDSGAPNHLDHVSSGDDPLEAGTTIGNLDEPHRPSPQHSAPTPALLPVRTAGVSEPETPSRQHARDRNDRMVSVLHGLAVAETCPDRMCRRLGDA